MKALIERLKSGTEKMSVAQRKEIYGKIFMILKCGAEVTDAAKSYEDQVLVKGGAEIVRKYRFLRPYA